MRDFADLRLSHFAERSQGTSKLRLAQTEKEIGLIFARVAALSQNCVISVVFNDRVMPRCDIVATQSGCFAPEVAKLELLVAHHTRVWRAASLVFAGEIINDQPLELVGLINDVMWNSQRMRHAARISNRLGSAAFVFRAGDTILRPYFHGYADDLVALLAQQISCDAGVHSPAHPQQNALFLWIHPDEELLSRDA